MRCARGLRGTPGNWDYPRQLIRLINEERGFPRSLFPSYYERMRIDAHQRFWSLNRFSYSWMPEGESRLKRNFLPEDLAPILEDARMDGTVAVQATTDIAETHWLLELAKENAFIKGVVGWVDLTAPQLGQTLDELQRKPHFKGVRHPVHDEEDARWILRDDVVAGLGELARRGIPYDLLIRPMHLPLIPMLAERVPGLRMVIDHAAKPLVAGHELKGWAEDLELAAQIPDMHCKLSGLVTEADPQAWTAADLKPYLTHALSVFGPERCMFGSDWPVCLLAARWKQVLAAFTQALGPLPQAVRDQLMGDTAVAFYNLKRSINV